MVIPDAVLLLKTYASATVWVMTYSGESIKPGCSEGRGPAGQWKRR